MVTNEIRKVRCDDVLTAFMASSRGCVFLTLTTPDVVDLAEIRERWRLFRHEITRKLKSNPKYVMNYEVHPNGHGWHIHSVFNRYLPHEVLLPLARASGFGRLDVRRVGSAGVAEYLTKHALKAYAKRTKYAEKGAKRARLVNTSRGLPRLCDYHYESARLDDERKILRLLLSSRLRPSFLTCAQLARLAVDCNCSTTLDVLDLYRKVCDSAFAVADLAETFTHDAELRKVARLYQEELPICESTNENADGVQAVSAATMDCRTENARHDYD